MLSEMTGANDDKDVIVMSVSRELAEQSREPEVANFPARYRDLTQAGLDRLVPGHGINIKVWESGGLGVFAVDPSGVSDLGNHQLDRSGHVPRSADRRVGKGCARTCRSRWSPDH